MARRLLKTGNAKNIIVNSETDTEIYQTDIHNAPYSILVEEFRVLVHETSHGKYLYERKCAPMDTWYTTRILTSEEVVHDIQEAMSDVDMSEKAWPTETELEKMAAYGIDVFQNLET